MKNCLLLAALAVLDPIFYLKIIEYGNVWASEMKERFMNFQGNTAWADVQHDENNVGKISCVFSKMVLNMIDEIRGDKPTKKDNENAVNNVCNILPSIYKTDCESLIKGYGDKIIKLLNNGVPVQSIPSQLKLCNTEIAQEHMAVDVVDKKEDEEENERSINPLCDVCEIIIKAIYKGIESDRSEEKIKDVVHHVCHIIPKHHQEKCNDFIDKHGDQVIKLILEVASPKLICHVVHACL